MVEINLKDLNVSKTLQRFARLLNCERVVQIVKFEGIYRQVKIDSFVKVQHTP